MSGSSFDAKEVLHAIDLIYSASLNSERWIDFLWHLSKISGGVRTHLVGQDHLGHVNSGVATANYDQRFIDAFIEYYGTINPWLRSFLVRESPKAYSVEEYVPKDELMKTEFYSDWVLPQENHGAGGGVVLFKDKTKMYLLGGQVGYKDQETLEPRYVELLDLFAPHIRNSVEIARTLHGRSLQSAIVTSYLDQLDAAVMIISENGALVFANQKAGELLDSGAMVHRNLADKLVFIDQKAQGILEKCYGFSKDLEKRQGAHFSIRDPDSNSAYVCRISSFLCPKIDFNPFEGVPGAPESSVLVTIAPRNAPVGVKDTLQIAYGLTESEAEIAMFVAEGATLPEIADRRSVSLHTVRTQLKISLSKMDVHRQVDLVRVIEELRISTFSF